ncbi:protein Wnt-8b [Lycaon pictus]
MEIAHMFEEAECKVKRCDADPTELEIEFSGVDLAGKGSEKGATRIKRREQRQTIASGEPSGKVMWMPKQKTWPYGSKLGALRGPQHCDWGDSSSLVDRRDSNSEMCEQEASVPYLLHHQSFKRRIMLLTKPSVCIFLFTCILRLGYTWSVNNFLMTGPKAYLIYSSSVAAGAQSGIEECKYQFAWDRWNCPERALQLSSHGGLRSANRETAFVHAISSAGVMYTLTRNCSLGDFDNCGCDDSRNGQLGGQGWLWGGCSDNVGFGEAISKQFVDALETGQDARAAMNLHNNEAGRKAVKGTMKRTCKCHGVSGSCTTQTCWLQLPEFREVGAHLKEKYHAALKVDLLQGAGNSAAGRGAIADTFRSISTRELVHLEDSPDYCLENKTLGLLGTEGRECLRRGRALGRWERRSCRRLCGDCGLAVEERRAETVSSCNCKFHWCCAVRCEQCRRRVTKYFCSRAERPRGGAAHKPGRKS